VGRGVRHVGRAALGHPRAQVGEDLAQQVELLEDGLERQAGVIDEEELPLVVPDVVTEAERALEHLLRRADGQRGRLAEVLQRGPVAVDGGVVEVGAELVDRVLAVLPHEELSAQADDGLVVRTVAVVLEAAPVEVDHLLGVGGRPEDVVVEEAVAVVRRLLGDLGAADRAVPDERRDAVERPRGRGEALERRPEAALPVDDVLAPEAVQQRVVLDREVDALPDVLAEPRVDRAGVAASHHQVDAAVGEVLELRVVLRDQHRIGRRDQRRRGGEDDALGLGADVGQRRRGRRGDERRVVVLAGRDDVEADVLGLPGDLDRGLDALVLGGRPARRRVRRHVADGEDPELHDHSSGIG
jgi:hypothetical protein